MFRLVRLCILIVAAFAAGALYERARAQTACAENGGTWSTPFCIGAVQQDD